MSELEYNIRPLQEEVLKIFKVFAAICEKHGLRYYAAYGTALGAIRHHGFIPWDDDFDVSMPRCDYDKFRVIAKDNLPRELKYCDWHNTKELTPHTYAKIQVADRDVVQVVETKLKRNLPHGVYIDIFPLDGAPQARLMRSVWLLKFRILLAVYSALGGSRTSRRLKSIAGRAVGVMFNTMYFHVHARTELAKYFDRLVRSCVFGNGVGGCVFGPYGVLRDVIPVEAYGEPQYVRFEDTSIAVPHNCDAYLRNIYGNYMVMPPVEKRISSHAELADAPWKFGPTAE